MNKLYVVEMLRHGDRESHSYVVGVFSTYEKARDAGEINKTWRALKYDYYISEHVLDYILTDKLKYHQSCGLDAKEFE